MTNKQVILIIEDEKNIGNYIETIIIMATRPCAP